MNKTHLRIHTSFWRRLRTILLSAVLLCLFLLSACSGATTQSTTTTTASTSLTPTADLTLQNEGNAQLQTFQQWIALMQRYKGNITTYQQQYQSDQQALRTATSDAVYKTMLHTLHTHVEAIQIPAMKTESTFLLQKLQQDAAAFGKQHTYHDAYNNTTYPLGYEYGSNGATSSTWFRENFRPRKV